MLLLMHLQVCMQDGKAKSKPEEGSDEEPGID